MSLQKTRVLSRVFKQNGARGVLDAVGFKLRSTWRRGEVWQLGRFVGMQTDIIRLDGCKFSIDKNHIPANVIDLLLSDSYEEPERAALKKFVKSHLPVIELGACIGVVSCLTNRRLHHPQNHVVVEANPTLLPILQQNRDRNQCQFQIVHAAVSSGAESIIFNVNENILASSVQGSDRQGVVVPTVTLARLLHEYGFERATLICDIEGAELQMVDSELETLREKIATIIMELHDRIVGEEPTRRMLAHLQGAGFAVAQVDGDVVVLKNKC